MKKVLLLASALAALLLLSGCAKTDTPANETDDPTTITDTTTDPSKDGTKDTTTAANDSSKDKTSSTSGSGSTGSTATNTDKKTSDSTTKKPSSTATTTPSSGTTKPSGGTTTPSGGTTTPSGGTTKDPGTDTPKQPETPMVDKTAEKQKEIEEENKKYQDAVSRITISYDSEINIKKSTVKGLMQKCGVSSLNSESYYANQYNSLQTQINTKSRQLAAAEMDGRKVEAARLQKEVDDLYAQSEACLVLKQAAREQDQLYKLEDEKQTALNDAYRDHQARLADIENKYK